MFSLLQTFVAPFVIAFGGRFFHDTVEMVIPPVEVPIDISYVPDIDHKCLVIGLTFGKPREFDPSTGTIGPEMLSTDIGIYHREEDYMDWHWDPFVESILNTNPYPQLLWASREKPYELRIVNNTGKFVWTEMTFWVVRFPKRVSCPIYGTCDPEELFKVYMLGVTSMFIAAGEAGAAKLLDLLQGGRQ